MYSLDDWVAAIQVHLTESARFISIDMFKRVRYILHNKYDDNSCFMSSRPGRHHYALDSCSAFFIGWTASKSEKHSISVQLWAIFVAERITINIDKWKNVKIKKNIRNSFLAINKTLRAQSNPETSFKRLWRIFIFDFSKQSIDSKRVRGL